MRDFIWRLRAGGPMRPRDYAISLPISFAFGICLHLLLRYWGVL